MARILIAGCGYVGTALGLYLAADGHKVWGMSRRPYLLPAEIQPLIGDFTLPGTLSIIPPDLDYVFYTVGATAPSEAAYQAAYVDGLRNLIEILMGKKQALRRIIFTSSTAVYAQQNGEWVDEHSPAEASYYSGHKLLEGEHLLGAGPFPATVVRLGGIYGPGRSRLLDQMRRGTAVIPAGAPIYTNRIHRDDCAGVLRHVMNLEEPDTLYLGVDDEPADLGAVLRWLAGRLGLPEPPVGESAESELGRLRGNKRCRNARLLATDYRFRYPTYREGFAALMKQAG